MVILDNVQYRAHRVIWKWAYGNDPELIDHINNDRRDNRLANLRQVDEFQNARNSRGWPNNKSGYKGVTAHKNRYFAAFRAST